MIKLFTWRSKLRLDQLALLARYRGNVGRASQGKAAGLLYNQGALWVGAHYSPANRRWCINLVPCFTVWYTNGGYEP